jgi:hypothetical protein
MFVCFGILALAVAYHLGASSAQSQVGEFVGIAFPSDDGWDGSVWLLAANGDCYWTVMNGGEWHYRGNPLSGTATQDATWGSIKAQFK